MRKTKLSKKKRVYFRKQKFMSNKNNFNFNNEISLYKMRRTMLIKGKNNLNQKSKSLINI